MKIDLHVHTSDRSACGKASEAEQIHAAIQAGLDAIVFMDHRRLAPVDTIKRLNDTYAPFRVFGGIELTVDEEDVIILGINDSRLETIDWSYPELHAFTRENGGFIAVAHPFRNHQNVRLDLKQFTPDAIEAYSPHTPVESAEQILEIISYLDVNALSNSDAHDSTVFGKYYNILNKTPSSEKELIDLLKKGRFRMVVNANGSVSAESGRSECFSFPEKA